MAPLHGRKWASSCHSYKRIKYFWELCKIHPNIPILYIRNLSDLKRTVSDSVKGIMYVNPGMKNSHFLRLRDLTHIQLGHGESDKLASAAKQMRSYDIIAVAGQGAVDRFSKAGMTYTKINSKNRPAATKETKRAKGSTPIKTILYAPTWEA